MDARGKRRLVVAVLLVLAALPLPLSPVPFGPVGTVGTAHAATSGVCPSVELPVDGVPAVANPFDPAEADVWGVFRAPDGSELSMPAYYTADFDRSLVDGRERLTPNGSGHWVLRFTPTMAGTWQWHTTMSIDGGPEVASATQTFTCAADPDSHGFLRRSPDDARYLRWEDGTPYTAIGENLAWYDQRGTYAYDAWLDQLAAHDVNWIRVWMPSWAFGLEWLQRDGSGAIVSSSLGNYTTRLDRAWQLDYVIEAARSRGIVVMLTIQNHGAFTVGANTEWVDNPYNAANGGPIADPTQVFTDPTARDLFARRIRYLVARWGHATNLIWELWNEVDLTRASIDVITPWHAEMGQLLRALDPYDHLQTTSVNGALFVEAITTRPPVWIPLYELPEMDIVQIHIYGTGADGPLNLVKVFRRAYPKLAAVGKPVLLGEVGVDYRGPSETLDSDPTSQGYHEALWVGLFAGGSGSGMGWWWDNLVDPQDLYGMFDGLAALTKDVGLDREQVRLDGASAVTSSGAALDVLPLRGDTASLVWVRNPDNWWHEPDLTTIAGATLTIDDVAAGAWLAQWIDPFSGDVVASTDLAVGTPSDVVLAVPAFTREAALRLTLTGPPPTTTTTTATTATTATPGSSTTAAVDSAPPVATTTTTAATAVVVSPRFTG